MTEANDLAFPAFDQDGLCPSGSMGLTKREYFAAKIMAGLYADYSNHGNCIQNAEYSVKAADALIEALNK